MLWLIRESRGATLVSESHVRNSILIPIHIPGNRSSYNLLAHDTPVSSRLNSRQPSEIPAAGSCSTKIASQFCPENATVAVGTQRFAWSDRGMESSQKEFRPATRIIDRKHLDSKNLLLQDHKVSAPLPEERRGVKASPAPELKETPAQGVKIFSNHDNTFLTSRVFAPVPANYCYRRMKGLPHILSTDKFLILSHNKASGD